MNVSAKDKATGKEQKITITASTNLTSSEVDRLVREAEQNRAQDEQRAAAARLRNEADAALYEVEKRLAALGEKVDSALRLQAESTMNDLREALRTNNQTAIQRQVDQLRSLLQQLEAAPSGSGQQRPDDVVEGQFTEA